MNPYIPHVLSRSAADGILNSLFAGIVIALLAWAIARIVRRQGSGTRFAVWFLALVAIALLPLVGHFAAGSVRGVALASTSALTLPESFASYLFVAWIIGALLGLMHIAHGLYRLRRLRATCTAVDLNQLDPSLRDSLADARVHRPVTLCTSDSIRVPAAIGYLRPIVVFPAWTLTEIPPAELNAILLHELAHLRRWDDWTNLAQKLVKAVFFFHPAVWFIESRLTLEREMACDDAVLAGSFSPRAYAESLVSLAEKSFLRRGIQLAQAAVGHVQQLKVRLAEILRTDKARQGSGLVSKLAIALMSLTAVIAVYGVSRAPRLIAFSSDAPQIASTSPAVHISSAASDVQLRPVNLSYTVHSGHSTVPVRKVGSVRVRTTHRLTPKPHVLRGQNMREVQMIADELAPPMMVLSNLPVEPASAPVLVIFQGEQFGKNGPVFWRVTIVHLTPSQRRAITGGFSTTI